MDAPRVALAETDTNSAVLAARKAKSQSQQATARHPRMVGEEFRNWQRLWRAIMKLLEVYFDAANDSSRKERAGRALTQVGAKILLFFHKDVSIIVTTREFDALRQYGAGDVFRIAIREKMKVWTYDKLFRFLANLADPLAGDHNDSLGAVAGGSKLQLLLRREKLYGPLDRDLAVRRDDFHYFKGAYLFVYDLRQKHRPVAAREWKGDTESVPRLHSSTDGRCPFLAEYQLLDPERRQAKRLKRFQETRRMRHKLAHYLRLPPSALPLPIIYAHAKSDGESGCETAEEALPVLAVDCPQSTLLFGDPRPNPLKRRFFEIEASGVHNNSTTTTGTNTTNTGDSATTGGNGLAPTVAEVRNPKVGLLAKVVTLNKMPLAPAKVNTARDEGKAARALLVGKENRDGAPVRVAAAERVERPGYCENCRVKYDHFEDHVGSSKHRAFATTEENFVEIDELVERLSHVGQYRGW